MHSQHSLNARLLRFRSQPHSEDAYALVEDLIDAGRHADARSVIALAKPEDREDAQLLLMEGRAHLLERDLIRAQAALLAAVKAEPNLQQAYRYLGEVLLKRGDPLRARKTLRRALALDGSDEAARELLERAETLVEAANDSLEALPSPRDSEFDVDAQAEQQAADFVDQLPSEPALEARRAPQVPQPPAAAQAPRGGREDDPTSQVRHGRRKGVTPDDEAPLMPPNPPAPRGAAAREAKGKEPPWDSEPAAPHPEARRGAAPPEPKRKPLPPPAAAGRPPAPAAAGRGNVGLPPSPRGAWTRVESDEDAEPAASHTAAVSGRAKSLGGIGGLIDDALHPSAEERPFERAAPARAAQRGPTSAADSGTERAQSRGAGHSLADDKDDHAVLPGTAGGQADRITQPRRAQRVKERTPASAAEGGDEPALSRAAGGPPAREPAGVPRSRDPRRSSEAPADEVAARLLDEGGAARPSRPPASVGSNSEGWPARSSRPAASRAARSSIPAADGGELSSPEEVAPGRSSRPASAERSWLDEGRRTSRPAASGGGRGSVPDMGSDYPSLRQDAADGGRELSSPAGAVRSAPPPLPPSHRPQPAERGKRLSHFRSPKEEAAVAPQAAAVEFAAESGGDDGPADADQVLSLVQQLGLFEDPSAQPAAWATRGDVEASGQRVRGTLLWIWGVCLLLCAGGYFGWNQFVERRHEAAAGLVAQARVLMSVGDHAALVDAERLLRMAREQHPASLAIPEEALFVQLQRVLEDGERDTAALRSSYARAQAAQVKGTSLALANLLLSAADHAGRDAALAQVVSEAKGDARSLYLLGRAEERMGLDAAGAHFEAAAAADAKLIPAQLALAERAYERGERAAAMRTLDAAVAAAPNQLRVRLFRMLVAADDVEPDKLRQDLNGLAEPLRKGNGVDQALAALVRARLARRSASAAAAQKAIDAAAGSGVEDARVLGWLAEEALAIGNSLLAQQLASRALSMQPERMRSRRLLARILVERGAGQQAFVLLASMPAADPEVQAWRARAALLSNDPELLRAALAALPAASGKKSEADVQRAALRLRIETQLDPSKAVLDRARSLAHAAPTDPDALLALAEAALAMRDAKLAQNALKQRALLLPEDVQAQTLLGRSLRMGGDSDGAEAAFRHALSLRPGYVEAQAALAALLLDRGQFEQADAVYRELALRDETALSGRLGRVEALLGQGKLADAQVQLEAAPEAERATAAYREVAAKLALARGEVAQALKLLGPLSEELPKRASLRTLHADALLAAAQLSAAGDELDAALALDPELPEALLGRAELQLRSNKTKDALATLAKAEGALRERVRPPLFTVRRLSLLGRTLLERKKRGDAAAAVRALREATEQAAAPADTYFFLGEALTVDKDKAGAQTAYRRYIELAPSGAYRQRAQRMLGATR